MIWLGSILAGLLAAALQYGRSALRPRVLPLAILRAVAVAIVIALLFDAPLGRAPVPRPEVVLDGSESWLRAARGCPAWRAARDSAARLSGGRWLRLGDSLRADTGDSLPRDHASQLRPAADRASAAGTPLVVITDGELEDAELLSSLPRGSRVVVLPCEPAPDLAVAALEAPSALLAGDTLRARVTLLAGARGAGASTLSLRLDDVVIAARPLAAFAPWGEQTVDVVAVTPDVARGAVLRAVISASSSTGQEELRGGPEARSEQPRRSSAQGNEPLRSSAEGNEPPRSSAAPRDQPQARGAAERNGMDAEPRNDTLALGVEITRAPGAVLVSTAPDYDAREALAALRGVTSLPTRAWYRVAPGAWRAEGSLARAGEAEVRAAVRDAPLVVLHGDTSVFGPPRAATRASLLLFAPPAADDGEWFAAQAPASPLSATLSGLPLDSLPPLSVTARMPHGDWEALITHRGGSVGDRRVALVGWDEPRRIAVLGAQGLWRWRFRGGVRAQAFDALFGSLFDWLAGGRTDRRAVAPPSGTIRAGAPIVWRRGSATDSVVRVILRRRGAPSASDTVSLRFAEGAATAESPGLAAGVYDVTMPGGSAVLAVNVSRELLPRRATVRSGFVGGASAAGDRRSSRDLSWLYAVAVLLLCAEWLGRRQAGLR